MTTKGFDLKERDVALDLLDEHQEQAQRIPMQLRPALSDINTWFSELPEDLQRQNTDIRVKVWYCLGVLDELAISQARLAKRLDALRYREQ
jgi:hypothetical protein